jgi:hypothetical protein
MALPLTLFLAPGILLCVGSCVAFPVLGPHFGASSARVHARLDLEQAADVTPSEPAGFPLLNPSPTFVDPRTTVTVATVTVTLSSASPSASAGFGCRLISVKSSADILSCTYSDGMQCSYSLPVRKLFSMRRHLLKTFSGWGLTKWIG